MQVAAGTDGAVALGTDSSVTTAGSVALGQGSVAGSANIGSYGYTGPASDPAFTAAGQPTAGNSVVSVGSAGNERQVQNVAAGTLSATSTDAVNGSQLFETNRVVQSFDQRITDNTNLIVGFDERIDANTSAIRENQNEARAGISTAMAMSSLPQPYVPGASMVSGAAATFQGESSAAIGLSTTTESGRWVIKGSGAMDSRGNGGASFGAGFQW